MREIHHPGTPPQEVTVNFIDRARYSVYDDITSSALEELREISFNSTGLIPIVPSHPGFENLSEEEQNHRRHLAARGVLEPVQVAIDTALNQEYFDPQEFYETCGHLFRDAGALNPIPKPLKPADDIPFEEIVGIPFGKVEKMRKIYAKDQTNIRFLNDLSNLPHAMRREFRRYGVTLIIIRDELIPEIAERLKEQGIRSTYRKRKTEKVWVVSEQPLEEPILLRIPERKLIPIIVRKRRTRKDRRKKGSIWPSY